MTFCLKFSSICWCKKVASVSWVPQKWMGKRSFLLQNASPLWSANSSCVLLSRLVFHGERDMEIVEIVNVSFLSMYFGDILCEKKRLMTHSFERYRVLWDPMFSTQNYAFVSCQCSWQHIVCTMKILVSCEKFKYKIRTSSHIVKLVQIKKNVVSHVLLIFFKQKLK